MLLILLLLILMVRLNFLQVCVSTFFINRKQIFINGLRNLPRNPPDCFILEICVFNNFSLADELFAKALQRFDTSLSVIINLLRKLVLSLELPIIFNDDFKVSPVAFFVADFNSVSCKLDNFRFTFLYCAISYYHFVKIFYNTAHYYIKIFCIIYLCTVYFTYIVSLLLANCVFLPLLLPYVVLVHRLLQFL